MIRPRRTTSRRPIAAGALALALAIAASAVRAAPGDIYRMVDEHGVVHFSDDPRDPRFVLFMRAPPAAAPAPAAVGPYAPVEPHGLAAQPAVAARFHDRIVRAAGSCGLDPALVHAVVTVESAYNPYAVSAKGAIGLMQLMPSTAERYGIRNPRDPDANLRGGTRYLCDLLAMFDNDLALALAGYNAGENAVIRFNRRIPPFAETLAYVPKVLAAYRRMRPRPEPVTRRAPAPPVGAPADPTVVAQNVAME